MSERTRSEALTQTLTAVVTYPRGVLPRVPECVLRPVEDLDEIGWNDPIPFAPTDLACPDPDAVIPYHLPTDRCPLERAVTLAAAGMPVRRAARLCDVPESTLRRRVNRAKAAV